MKSDFVQIAFAGIALVVGGALEELLPKVYGVGAPVLLMAALFVAYRRPRLVAVLFALAAGAMEDALAARAPGLGSNLLLFFVLAWAVNRSRTVPVLWAALVYPCCQLLFFVDRFFDGRGGEVCLRFLVAIPLGAVTAAATGAALVWLERRAALDAD